MTLKQKFLFPLIIAPLAGFLGYFILNKELSEIQYDFYSKLVYDEQIKIKSALDTAAHYSLAQASLFARHPAVIRAFEIALQGDINDEYDAQAQHAREALRQDLKPLLDAYSDNFNDNKLKLHFHLPSGRSLVRLWRDKQTLRNGEWVDVSDDLSAFRASVLEVNRSGQVLKGVELGRDGLAVRGIVPIHDANGKQLGSVEVLTDFDTLFKHISTDETRYHYGLFLFMNADQMPLVTHHSNENNAFPHIGDKYTPLYSHHTLLGTDEINSTLLDRGRNSLYLSISGKFALASFPIHDYKQQQTGVFVYVLDTTEVTAKITRATHLLVWTLAATLFVMGVLIFFITVQFIISPLALIREFINKVRDGDDEVVLEKIDDDEIGELGSVINQLILAQRHVIKQIHRAGVQVTSSATQLAATAKEHKITIMAQVDSTENVVRSVKSINHVTRELVNSVEQVAAMSAETANFAASGQDNLAHMKESMAQMEHASKSISSKLEAINEKNENITSVVTTITKVAEQTNLLSLNAAIEAEKAGEYGHGFNVVAREIRRLADQTAVATLDIDRMVKEMQSAVSAGVMEMDKFISVVRHSAEDVAEISSQLTRIIEQVKNLSPNFEHVKVAMEQQSTHAAQINDEISALGEGMRQTADTLQESFQAIAQLNDAARGLQNEVEGFRNACLAEREKTTEVMYRGQKIK
jgi:methyl-accepting chemotaxis protein